MILARLSPAAALLVAASATWTPQTSGVTARLRGVSAVNDRVVWASGTERDGAADDRRRRHMEAVPVPDAAQLDFRDIDAFSESTAYVMSIGNGEASRIYKTVDGGRQWTLQLANKDPKIFLDAMAFWSPDAGIAFSDSVDGQFVIFSTTNGGRTWERVPADRLPPALPNEGAYAASGTNVAVSAQRMSGSPPPPRACCTRPIAGSTWTVAQTPVATSAAAGIFSIAFRDARTASSSAATIQKEREAVDNAAVTADGGKTWTLVKGSLRLPFRCRLPAGIEAHLDCRRPPRSRLSTDDGSTWTPVPGPGFHASASRRPAGSAGASGSAAHRRLTKRLATDDSAHYRIIRKFVGVVGDRGDPEYRPRGRS